MDEYPRCATCRHWTSCEDDVSASNAVYDSPPFYGRDDMVGWGVCWLVTNQNTDEALALSGNWWNGTLVTKPTFGCLLHDPNPGNNIP
jgi:hypothetical protein